MKLAKVCSTQTLDLTFTCAIKFEFWMFSHKVPQSLCETLKERHGGPKMGNEPGSWASRLWALCPSMGEHCAQVQINT